MKKQSVSLYLFAVTFVYVGSISAQDGPASPETNDPNRVELQTLVRQVAASENLQFLIDPRARTVFVAGTPIENPSYADLLGILRLNGYSAVEVDGLINIVPDANIRSYGLPIVQRDDADIPDDAWVTRIITVRGQSRTDGFSVSAALVPVLRPLLPQVAHFASNGEDKLIIVDRYANVKRISALVRELTE